MLGLKLNHVSKRGHSRHIPDYKVNLSPAGQMAASLADDIFRIGDKPLNEPKLTLFTDAYMRHLGGWRDDLRYVFFPDSLALMICICQLPFNLANGILWNRDYFRKVSLHPELLP